MLAGVAICYSAVAADVGARKSLSDNAFKFSTRGAETVWPVENSARRSVGEALEAPTDLRLRSGTRRRSRRNAVDTIVRSAGIASIAAVAIRHGTLILRVDRPAGLSPMWFREPRTGLHNATSFIIGLDIALESCAML